MAHIIYTAALLLFLLSQKPVNAIKHVKFDKLDWLLGVWEFYMNENLVMTEVWQKQNDSTLTGTGTMTRKGKVIFSEKLKIISRNNTIIYVAQVKDQNKGKGIEFILTDTAGGAWLFENPAHDFPQKITYKATAENALHARIEGGKKGKLKAEDFYFERAK